MNWRSGGCIWHWPSERQPEALPLELVSAGDWCALLRQRYHSEVCGGMNYARTADSTPDHCLAELLNGLSAAEYRHAERIRGLLERCLGQRKC